MLLIPVRESGNAAGSALAARRRRLAAPRAGLLVALPEQRPDVGPVVPPGLVPPREVVQPVEHHVELGEEVEGEEEQRRRDAEAQPLPEPAMDDLEVQSLSLVVTAALLLLAFYL